MLNDFRVSIWNQHHEFDVFGPSAILPDTIIHLLSSIDQPGSKDALGALISQQWAWYSTYGDALWEVLSQRPTNSEQIPEVAEAGCESPEEPSSRLSKRRADEMMEGEDQDRGVVEAEERKRQRERAFRLPTPGAINSDTPASRSTSPGAPLREFEAMCTTFSVTSAATGLTARDGRVDEPQSGGNTGMVIPAVRQLNSISVSAHPNGYSYPYPTTNSVGLHQAQPATYPSLYQPPSTPIQALHPLHPFTQHRPQRSDPPYGPNHTAVDMHGHWHHARPVHLQATPHGTPYHNHLNSPLSSYPPTSSPVPYSPFGAATSPAPFTSHLVQHVQPRHYQMDSANGYLSLGHQVSRSCPIPPLPHTPTPNGVHYAHNTQYLATQQPRTQILHPIGYSSHPYTPVNRSR